MATALPSSLPLSSVKVNITLCGSLPRREMESLSLSKCATQFMPSTSNSYLSRKHMGINSTRPHAIEDERLSVASQLCSQLQSLRDYEQPCATQRSVSSAVPVFEAPTWAVPASGEARLEPISDSSERQGPVDLTDRAVFRIGRSPQSDVHLIHATSSRRHAMLFHHSNGSCYLVDCGSAHGTYVNGVRVISPPKGGVVVPHKVKRGSIIRFGGPGAPQFMLKSFTFDLEEMREEPTVNSNLTPTSSLSAVVEHNTRLNSLGRTAKNSLFLSLTSKRSFDSMETVESDFDSKRSRCSSPPLSPEPQLVRLVSPDLGQPSKRRRVSFSNEPPEAFYPNLISPDLSSDENDEMS